MLVMSGSVLIVEVLYPSQLFLFFNAVVIRRNEKFIHEYYMYLLYYIFKPSLKKRLGGGEDINVCELKWRSKEDLKESRGPVCKQA